MIRLAVTRPGHPEIFHAIQGEGASLGRPSLFVRLSQCNLHCVWCDTPYTWNFEGTEFTHRDDGPGAPAKFDRASETLDMASPALAEQILSQPCRRVVFTGGEPLLQQRELGQVCAALKSADPAFHLEVETNGTIAPAGALAEHADQFNVSPKLAHSGNDLALRRRADVLKGFAGDARAWFKFVIAAPGDINEVDEIVAQTGAAPARVFLMPEGVTSGALRAKAHWLVPLCLERGYGFSDRLHIHLHGDTRGT